MFTKDEIANIKRINQTLDGFKKRIASAQAKIDVIEEEFRKKCEAKKKELVEEVNFCTSEIDFWQAPVIARYNKTTDEILGELSKDEEKEEKIVDNDVQQEVEEVPVEESVEVEAAEEEPSFPEEETGPGTDEPVLEEPEFDGAGFTEDDNFEPKEDWETSEEEEIEEEEEEEDDVQWPDLPEEW